MRSWIAGVTVAMAMATPLTVTAGTCNSQALLAACGHAVPADASFADLMAASKAEREGDASPAALLPVSQSAPTAAVTQPAVYTGAVAPVLSPAVDTPLAGGAVPGWLPIPAAGPAPDFAWVLALGFLVLIVLRRTRAVRVF
jgi:hypothetical protein